MLKVLGYIQGRLDEEISLDELAKVACFSPYHFHRIFRGMVGESVKEHIRRLRLERAASRLKNGSRSVTEIAFEAGYEAHEAFTRAFVDMFGVAPREFRSKQNNVAAEAVKLFQDDKEVEAMKAEIVNFESVRVVFVKHVGPYNECGKAWGKLCLWAGPEGLLGPGCKFLGLCYNDPEVTPAEKIRYDACISIDDKEVSPDGEIGVQTINGGSYAMTTHFGPYEKLSETYAQLCGQWVPSAGYEIAGRCSVEIYQNSPEDTEPEDLITDIYVPLETR